MEINVEISHNRDDYVEASYSFKSGGDTQMSIDKNDLIQVVAKPEGSGWWQGFKKNGDVGFFPKSYVRPLNAQERKELLQSLEAEDSIPPPPLPQAGQGQGQGQHPKKQAAGRLKRNSIPPPSEPPAAGGASNSGVLTPAAIKTSLQQQQQAGHKGRRL